VDKNHSKIQTNLKNNKHENETITFSSSSLARIDCSKHGAKSAELSTRQRLGRLVAF
jgi:hypothetical protein